LAQDYLSVSGGVDHCRGFSFWQNASINNEVNQVFLFFADVVQNVFYSIRFLFVGSVG
jgi:hypothetical protein